MLLLYNNNNNIYTYKTHKICVYVYRYMYIYAYILYVLKGKKNKERKSFPAPAVQQTKLRRPATKKRINVQIVICVSSFSSTGPLILISSLCRKRFAVKFPSKVALPYTYNDAQWQLCWPQSAFSSLFSVQSEESKIAAVIGHTCSFSNLTVYQIHKQGQLWRERWSGNALGRAMQKTEGQFFQSIPPSKQDRLQVQEQTCILAIWRKFDQ